VHAADAADPNGSETGLTLQLPETLVDALAARAAEVIAEQNAGFLDVKGAAEFLGGWSRKRIYNLVERGAIPFYKPQGRLLFDPDELREWVMEAGHGRR
jgi:excisionase family DNA binding protein